MSKNDDIYIRIIIAIIISVFFFCFTAEIARMSEELQAARNAVCVAQYGEGSYYKAIDYGRRASTVEYCMLKDGELKILRDK